MIPSAKCWLTEAMAASSETLGLVMLQADPQAWRLDRVTQLAAVSDALADGAAVAKAWRARFPDHAPQQIAREFHLPIETTNNDPMVGSLWRFAEYRQRPAGILLYSRGLAPLERVAVGALAERLLGQATPREVFMPMNCIIMPKRFAGIHRSRSATGRHCLRSAAGIGALE